jgi:hypothetical protein
MSEKRLFQVNWGNGQTDGDDVGGTVRRILNMDLDSIGMLKTRSAFTRRWVPEFDGIGNVAHTPYSPSWSSATSWVAMIRETKVALVPVVGQEMLMDNAVIITVPDIADSNHLDVLESQITSYGDKFFLCAILEDGTNAGVFMISSPETDKRFRATTLTRGTAVDGEQAASTETWSIKKLENDKPGLVTQLVTGFAFLDDDEPGSNRNGYSAAGVYHWPTSRAQLNSVYEDGISGLINRTGNSEDVIGLVVAMVAPDDDVDYVHGQPPYSASLPGQADISPNQGMFGRSASIAFKVQLIYYGGGLSRLSDESIVSGWNEFPIASSNDEVQTYALGIAPVVNKNINRSVKGINIYRKIISSGNTELPADENFMLVRTVWLDSEALEDQEIEQGVTNMRHDLFASAHHRWGYYDEEYDLGNPISSYAWTGHSSTPDIAYQWTPSGNNRIVSCSGGTAHLTSGWVAIGSTHMLYLDTHFEAECTYEYEEDITYPGWSSNVPNWWVGIGKVTLKFSAKVVSNTLGSGSSIRTLIRGGSSLPSVSMTKNSLPAYRMFSPLRYADRLNRSFSFESTDIGSPGDKIALMGVTQDAVAEYSGTLMTMVTGGITYGNEARPFIAFRDVGEVVLDDELSVMGGSDKEFINVRPDSIAIVGGRMCGISGYHDGEAKPSRLSYSQFQNYGMVLDSSYLDYGARSDGEAKAISSHRGAILIHFAGATYVVDVSGGSDMAWRELGANSGIGILNKNCVVETPAGCVWCDSNGVYAFDGQSITEVSNIPQRGVSVKETYQTLIQTNQDRVRVNYRPDKKQVWISVGGGVLVFDLSTGAWHEHELSEIEAVEDYDIVGIWEFAGELVLAVRYASGVVSFCDTSDVDEDCAFDWGVDIKFTADAPELIKKAKRFYVDAMSKGTGHKINARVYGRGAVPILQDLPVVAVSSFVDPENETMVRFSASARGRSLQLVVRNLAGDKWQGAFGSLGMSHKSKSLK